jgi:beta-aspartyl-dipeptidase (metallo-type)
MSDKGQGSGLFCVRGAEVWAPAPLGKLDVLLGGGKVLAMAPSLPRDVAAWGGMDVDAGGAWLFPGLVDAHAHLTGGGGEGGAHTRVPAVPLSAFTLAGVTTAVGLLGTDCTTRSVAENLACARALSHLGITALAYTGGYPVPPVTLTGSVRGDIVHVDRVIAVGEVAISDHRSSQPTFEEIARIAADAHVAGMMTGKAGLLHLHLGDGARGLSLLRRALEETELPARTFHPTHCNRNRALWEEAKAWGAQGGFADVTAFPDDDTAAGDVADWIRSGLAPERVTVSSDAGGCMPHFDDDGVLLAMDVGTSSTLLPAVRGMVERGVALELALATVTSNVAALFRLPGKGRIAVGADADVVLVDPGSFAVRDVWAGGRWLVGADRGQGAWVVRGPFER